MIFIPAPSGGGGERGIFWRQVLQVLQLSEGKSLECPKTIITQQFPFLFAREALSHLFLGRRRGVNFCIIFTIVELKLLIAQISPACLVCVYIQLQDWSLSLIAVTNYSNSSCTHRPIRTNATTGYISTLGLGENGQASVKCPVLIEVSRFLKKKNLREKSNFLNAYKCGFVRKKVPSLDSKKTNTKWKMFRWDKPNFEWSPEYDFQLWTLN